jgi:hypothetical protein
LEEYDKCFLVLHVGTRGKHVVNMAVKFLHSVVLKKSPIATHGHISYNKNVYFPKKLEELSTTLFENPRWFLKKVKV